MSSNQYGLRTEIYEKGMRLYLNHHSVGLAGNHVNPCEIFFCMHAETSMRALEVFIRINKNGIHMYGR